MASYNSAQVLIQREFMALKRRPKSNYFQVYDLVDENMFEWIVYMIGPPQTPYAGGIFRAIMRFPTTYPMEPPSVQFVSTIYHPNVYRDGKVCISTLQTPKAGADSSSEYWRPVLGVEQALLSVCSLLSDPNCDDPANQDAAHDWVNNREAFASKVERLVKKTKKDLPADFVMPVVVSSAPSRGSTGSSSSSSSSSAFAAADGAGPKSSAAMACEEQGHTTDKDEDGDPGEMEVDYVYSDDEDDASDDGFVFSSKTKAEVETDARKRPRQQVEQQDQACEPKQHKALPASAQQQDQAEMAAGHGGKRARVVSPDATGAAR